MLYSLSLIEAMISILEVSRNRQIDIDFSDSDTAGPSAPPAGRGKSGSPKKSYMNKNHLDK
jgi:hypothetical protein